MKKINWEKEMKRCKENPYYYATKHLIVNGKPFTTHLDEKQFNAQFVKSSSKTLYIQMTGRANRIKKVDL